LLKFGICTLEELDRAARGGRHRLFRRFCSVTLYEALALRGRPGDEALQAEVLDLFPIANGAYKRTGRVRFGRRDREVAELLAARFPRVQPLAVHDMAVSDARTACDFFAELTARLGDAIRFYASDACIRVTVWSRPGDPLEVVADDDGNILQLIRPPLVLPISRTESWLYPVNRLLRGALMRRAREYAAGRPPQVQSREILLLCNEARSLRAAGRMVVERGDLFEPPARRYHVVRAMNVLNPTYFSRDRLALAIRRVHESLEEGGLFVVGSNDDAGSEVHGGVYERREDGFFPRIQWGNGPAITALLSAPLAANGSTA